MKPPSAGPTAAVALAAALSILAAPEARATTWTVGGPRADFPLISPALELASDGDTVLVSGGVYREDLVVRRRISLLGRFRPILIGTGAGTVVSLEAAGAEVRGFDIEGSGTGLSNAMDAAVLVEAPGCRVADNRVRRVFYGVVVRGVSGGSVSGNEISGFADLPFGARGDGIYLYRAPDNEVSRNRITGMRDAIYLQYSPRCRIAGNSVDGSRYGLHDMFSDDATIAGNVLRGCSVGASVMNCRRVAILDNTFERNQGISSVGLSLKECDESRVERNRVADNARGFQIEGSSRNRFTANRLLYNDVALQLFASAEENVFSGNVFESNRSALLLSGWTTTARFESLGRGNFWSGYRGFDFDGDGIGEAPHPLLEPFEKLEGNNPAVRLFLQSPAAEALGLAARALPRVAGGPADPFPLVLAPPSSGGARGPGPFYAGAALAAATFLTLTGRLAREIRPCSKS